MAVGFAERAFGLEVLGVDDALDDELRLRGQQEVDGAPAHDVDRRARKSARDRDLVDALRQLLRSLIGDDRRTADDDRDRHRRAAVAVLLPMGEPAGAERDQRHHAEPGRGLEMPTVGADVLHPGVGIAGDDAGRGEIGRSVEARRRDRDRQRRETTARAIERWACDHDVMARRTLDETWRHRVRDGARPARADLVVARDIHADTVDRGIRRERPEHHGDVVMPSGRINDVGEQERLAVALRDTAAELPAHQRMHLGVFVDRRIDAPQQAGLFETVDVVVEVGVAALEHQVVPASRLAKLTSAANRISSGPGVKATASACS